MSNDLLEHALRYAKFGWRVLPCKKDKHPLIKEWQHRATKDPDTIKEWWEKWPDASIGCACGPESGIWVLDLDLPDGPDTMQAISDGKPMPEKIMEQETGSGGRQLFFHYNGTEIRNSARKVGPGIDVRGKGGYVVLPPSPHPSGGQYKWIQKAKPQQAPDWLIQLVKADPPPQQPSHVFGQTSQYGQKALADEIVSVSMASPGTRNETLNTASFRMGQLIAGGELEHAHVVNSLIAMALTTGLSEPEARKTIESGITGGGKYPRKAPESNDIKYDLADEHNEHNEHYDHQCTPMNIMNIDDHPVNINEHSMNIDEHNQAQNPKPTPNNLKAAIFEFIENSKGSFNTKDIDTEFGLTTRREKQTRSQALYMAREKNLIRRDKRTAGKYIIIDSSIEWIDLENVEESDFPIALPFNLHDHVKIPPKAIIVLAGTFNSGKTAFILNTLRANIHQKYEILYLMSEMGPAEFKGRITSFKDPIAKWKKVKAASKSYDFDGAIQHYNPDGLTCIDFLEEVEGEYFKIASSIRDIYDSLNNGVAFISIQKKAEAEYARGGQATMEKPRLVMNLDYMCQQGQSIICALKITKVKGFKDKNLQGHEIHFRLSQGTKIEAVSEWTLSSRVDRKKMASQYELERNDIGEWDYVFNTDKGIKATVKQADVEKWEPNFNNINIWEELQKLSDDSFKRGFIKYNGYFHQISGILRKKNEERSR